MSAPKPPPAPERVDYGTAAVEGLFGTNASQGWASGLGIASPEIQQAILEAERQYGPEYVRNEVARQAAAVPGLLDIVRQTTPAYREIATQDTRAMREADISDLETYGGRATEAYRQSDPQRLALINRQQGLTSDLYDRAGGVTPQQARMAQQSAREGYGARGRALDNASIFAEALGREDYMRENRQEAQGAGLNLFSMLQQSGADPAQAVLGRAGTAPYGGGTAFGAPATGQVGPSLFNTDSFVNLALANNANQANYNANIYGAQAGRQGAILGGIGQGLGSVIGSGLSIFGG